MKKAALKIKNILLKFILLLDILSLTIIFSACTDSTGVSIYSIEETKNNTGLTINIALSYGGRAEITDAVNKILAEKKPGEKIDEKEFTKYLYAPDIPDPDLLIRTSGELRLSNFLLWQLSYSEIYVTETHWPDFDKEALQKALDSFGKRKRRFGGLNK